MRWLNDLRYRLRALFDRGRMERDMDDEFAFHLEMEERKYRAQGMSEAEARRMARMKFGGVDRQKEQARSSWGVDLLQDLAADTRYALRQLRRRPAFSALAAGTLALGIGGTVALFSVVNGLLLRPLPVDDEASLVTFWFPYSWRAEEFEFLRGDAPGFDGLAAFSNTSQTLETDQGTQMLFSTVASAELFDVLGARPLLGRTFQAGDDRGSSNPVIVLSYGLWQQEFGGDRDIVGRRIVVDGRPTTVVGVMPRDFHFPSPEMRAWTPLDLDPDSDGYRGGGWLIVLGRTEAGMGPERVQQAVDAIGARLGERFDYPERWDKSRNPSAQPLREYLLGEVRPAVLLLLGAVGLLLLMACANVAALTLTRTMDRSREIGVRAALGAGRMRLVRQVLTESVLLGVAGGALGLVLAVAAFDVLVAMLPLGGSAQAFADTLHLDWTTLAAAMALAVGTGVLISLAPIRRVLRGDLVGPSSGERGQRGMGVESSRTQQALVVAEVALAVVLVTGAALLARSVDRLRDLDPGVNPEGVLAVNLYMSPQQSTEAERAAFFESLLARMRAVPGVRHAGLINRLPVRDGGYQGGVTIEGRPDLVGDQRPSAYYRTISPGALEALGVAPTVGRGLTETDAEGTVPAAVVNQSFVDTFWDGDAGLGRHFTTSFNAATEWQVVGVVPDMAIQGLLGDVGPAGYHPWSQAGVGAGNGVLVVKTDGDPTALAGPVRSLVSELDRRAAVGTVTTMQDVVDGAISQSLRLRFFLILFSALGLVLGSIGIYGVVSYGVERRRAEYGIRMALGARPRRLLGEVVSKGMAPVVVGVVAGVAVAVVAARAAGGVLYEIAPTDPSSLAAAALILLTAGAVAAMVPAWRASRVHPGVALRAE